MAGPLTGPWRARLVWNAPPPLTLGHGAQPSVPADAARVWVLLRKTFELDVVPPSAPLRATADARYRLWCNGAEVSSGPGRSDPRQLLVDHADLAPHLQVGTNVLAICARAYGLATPWWQPAPATYGLGGGMVVLEVDLGGEVLGTDATWRCTASSAWEELEPVGVTGIAPESVDARLLPPDWRDVDFDDSGWQPATELEPRHLGWDGRLRPPVTPYGALRLASVPQVVSDGPVAGVVGAAVARTAPTLDDPVDQVGADLVAADKVAHLPRRELPFTVELTPAYDAGMLVLDFGEQTAGTVLLSVSAPEGTRIDAKAAEALDADGHLDAGPQHAGFRYVARGHDDHHETFDNLGLRYLGLSLRGEGTVTVDAVRVRERRAPRPSGPSFRCDDEAINQIWAAGRRTVDLCAQDAYLDCPSREQRAWTGDAVVHLLVDLTTNADWTLAHRNVALAAAARPDGMLPMAAAGDLAAADTAYIPDWSLHWIHAAANLVRYTGDVDLARRLLPVAERILHWFGDYEGPDGLLHDVTGWILIDWSAVSTAGCSGALNALYGRALRDVRQLAELLGDKGRAEWAAQRWVRLRKAFQAFFDPERGLYVDQIIDGVRQAPVSQHTNAAAIVARLTRGVRDDELIERICASDRLVHASWLVPGEEALPGRAGDMYAGSLYLVNGPPAPWWDVERQIVAAQPFFRYVVHDAVAQADRADLLPELIRDWAPLLERSATTLSEVWFGGSHCHGWSATPTRDLMQYTLGVTPAVPGFARARIAPTLGDLAYAHGTVPTPSGLVTVQAAPDKLEIDTPIEADVVFGGIDTRIEPGHHVLTPR